MAQLFLNQTIQVALFSILMGLLLFVKDKNMDFIDLCLILCGGVGMALYFIQQGGIGVEFLLLRFSPSTNPAVDFINFLISLAEMVILSLLPFGIIKRSRAGHRQKHLRALTVTTLFMSIVVYGVIPRVAGHIEGTKVWTPFLILAYLVILYVFTTPKIFEDEEDFEE